MAAPIPVKSQCLLLFAKKNYLVVWNATTYTQDQLHHLVDDGALLQMMPLESSVSDATILGITLESSIMILEMSFTLIYDVYSTSITYDDCQLMSVIYLKYKTEIFLIGLVPGNIIIIAAFSSSWAHTIKLFSLLINHTKCLSLSETSNQGHESCWDSTLTRVTRLDNFLPVGLLFEAQC